MSYQDGELNVSNRNFTAIHENISQQKLSENQADYLYYEEYFSEVSLTVVTGIQTFGVPLILFPGILGNILSLVVFMKTHLKVQATSMYLAALNIFDLAFLLTLLPHWLPWMGHGRWLLNASGWCQTMMWLNMLFAFLSSWMVVCLSSERYIAVFHPWHRHRICRHKTALYIILILITAGCAVTSYPLWTVVSIEVNGESACLPNHAIPLQVLQTLVTTDTLLRFVLPAVLLVVLNGRIGYHIMTMRRRKKRRKLTTSGGSCSGTIKRQKQEQQSTKATHVATDKLRVASVKQQSGNANTCRELRAACSVEYVSATKQTSVQRLALMTEKYKKSGDTRRRCQMRATRSLVAITSAFFLLNLPHFVLRVQRDIITTFQLQPKRDPFTQIWQEVALLLYYLNFSANFFMYCLVSRHFRCALARLFQRLKRKICDCSSKS